MTSTLALTYIRKKMKDIGLGTRYQIKYRHINIPQNNSIGIDASNHYYIILHNPTNIVVISDYGVYDAEDELLNEIQYEHTGQMKILNKTAFVQSIRMIQVIPKNT
jgi:hypothetical protein